MLHITTYCCFYTVICYNNRMIVANAAWGQIRQAVHNSSAARAGPAGPAPAAAGDGAGGDSPVKNPLPQVHYVMTPRCSVAPSAAPLFTVLN